MVINMFDSLKTETPPSPDLDEQDLQAIKSPYAYTPSRLLQGNS